MTQENLTPGNWIVWQLSKDSDAQERQIITTEDGETEITGIIDNLHDAEFIVEAKREYRAMKEALQRIAAYKMYGEKIEDAAFRQEAIESGEYNVEDEIFEPSSDTECNMLREVVETARAALGIETE